MTDPLLLPAVRGITVAGDVRGEFFPLCRISSTENIFSVSFTPKIPNDVMWGSDGQNSGNGNQGGSWSRTVRSDDGSTVFTFGGGGPPSMFGPTGFPGQGFGVGVRASAGPGAQGGVAWGSPAMGFSQSDRPTIALQKEDQACFSRLRILDVMSHAPLVLTADECIAALRAAFIDFTGRWPAEWPQKEPHLNLLTAVYQAAQVMTTVTDTSTVRSAFDKLNFPSEPHATQVTWCLGVIIRRLRDLSFYRLSKPAETTSASASDDAQTPLGKWLQDN